MSSAGLPDPANVVAALPAGVARAAGAVLPALRSAAERTGTDFTTLLQMARLESGLKPDAKAASSSARGLFQFLDSTWLDVLRRHGAANGIGPLGREQALALRDDPAIASLMAAEHMRDNATSLGEALGRRPDGVDLYFAHFLGTAGASRFLGALDKTPDAFGAALFPAAARANRAIFYAGEAPRSLAEIHQLISARLQGERQESAAPPPRRLPVAAGSPPALAPRDAARIAYLLLADMGG